MRFVRPAALLSLMILLGAMASHAATQKPPVQLSSPYERMLREQIANGRVLPNAIIERFGLAADDEAERAPEGGRESDSGARPFGDAQANAIALGLDRQANDRSGDVTCAGGCAGRPLSQSETTVAALGNLRVVGWNDSKGFCVGAVQGWATSADGGVTFADQGDVPALPTGGRYRGDPVHFVDPSTGTFYVLGLYEETPSTGSGLALMNGHFSGTSFIVDGNRKILVGGTDFIDKEWGCVDPVTHNIYVTYSRFVGGATSQIELIRSTDGGTTWSAPLLMHGAAQNDLVQGSRPVIGPNGEVIVYWYESFTSFATPFSKHHVRISTDGGVTFGADIIAAQFVENFTTGGAGYRRGFAPTFASIAVDRSSGPRRGRIYLTWDESVIAYDAPAPSLGDKSEVEQNGNFANATAFSVGQRLRGTLTPAADSLDLWRFTGTAGQTVYFRTDSSSANANFQMRIQCSSDTALFQTMRFLAYNTSASSNALVYTLPSTGTYYVRMFKTGVAGSYRLLTSFDTPTPGERARDHRDQFAAWSDGGTVWSTPVRISDSPAANDGIFPEVAVDGSGRVAVYWHDWRDGLPCGAESAEYMVSSGDGGATWGPNQRLSDANSFWSINACGSANQGDYQGITTTGDTVIPAWADARNGDADVFTESVLRDFTAACPANPVVFPNSNATLSFSWTNSGNVDANIAWQVSDNAGWITASSPAASGAGIVAPTGVANLSVTVTGSSTCTPTRDTVRVILQDLNVPGAFDTCRVVVTCGFLDVPGGGYALRFDRPKPNPSTGRTLFTYSLPSDGPVRLELFGATGRRVRMLERGTRPAGLHVVRWDGLDDAGRRASPGVYFARLEAGGREFRQVLTVVR